MKRTGLLWPLAGVVLIAAAAPGTACAQGAWAVYVMNADGSEVQKVRLDNASLFGSPIWLSDDRYSASGGDALHSQASGLARILNAADLGDKRPEIGQLLVRESRRPAGGFCGRTARLSRGAFCLRFAVVTLNF